MKFIIRSIIGTIFLICDTLDTYERAKYKAKPVVAKLRKKIFRKRRSREKKVV